MTTSGVRRIPSRTPGIKPPIKRPGRARTKPAPVIEPPQSVDEIDPDLPAELLSDEERGLLKAEAKQLLDRLADHRAAEHEAGELAKQTQTQLLDVMKRGGMQSISTTKAKGTVVIGSSTVIDPQKLKKRVGATLWRKITTLVLDKTKLDAYVKSGEISPQVVAACSDERDHAPHVRVTRK